MKNIKKEDGQKERGKSLCIPFSWTLNSVLPKKNKWARDEKKRNQAELKRKQDKARNIIKKILNGFSCTWEFRYTKYNKQGHEIEHKRDVERNREEKQKSEKKRMSWMLEESFLKPTRRIKIFQAQCCAMRCMSLYFFFCVQWTTTLGMGETKRRL